MHRFTNVDHKPTRLPPVYGYRTHPLLPLRQALDPILSRIDELEDFIKTAKTECHYPNQHGLTRDESAAIYLYTMECGEQSLYRMLNQDLRVKDRSVLVPWHGYLKLFDTALKKLPNVQTSLWRGVDCDVSQNYKDGDEVTWWNYTSCSSSVKVVKQFLGTVSTIFMIESKNGKSIKDYSSLSNEKEVILGLGTRVRVVSEALDLPSINVVHLVELSDETEPASNKATTSKGHTYNNDNTYKDQSKNETKYGHGTNSSSTFEVYRYDDGSTYEGEWRNEKKHGQGTYSYADGDRYEGTWVNDKMEGRGIFTWATGDRYEKEYSQISSHISI